MGVEIDVRDLIAQPGSSRTVRTDQPVEELATELARVPEDGSVQARLLLESVMEGILVSGSVEGPLELVCARCLKSIPSGFQLDVEELFSPGADATDDEYPVVDGVLDLEPMIRDAVMLSFPFSPLCRPDCLGLCERCGGDRNVGECRCEPETDVRWAALETLEFPDLEDAAHGDHPAANH
jgi:uncharacterized protein